MCDEEGFQAKCLNCDQLAHYARDCTKPKKVLSNIS